MSETTQLTIEVPVAVNWQIEAIRAGIADADAGRVVDHHAVAAWLESWGTENELPAPRCD